MAQPNNQSRPPASAAGHAGTNSQAPVTLTVEQEMALVKGHFYARFDTLSERPGFTYVCDPLAVLRVAERAVNLLDEAEKGKAPAALFVFGHELLPQVNNLRWKEALSSSANEVLARKNAPDAKREVVPAVPKEQDIDSQVAEAGELIERVTKVCGGDGFDEEAAETARGKVLPEGRVIASKPGMTAALKWIQSAIESWADAPLALKLMLPEIAERIESLKNTVPHKAGRPPLEPIQWSVPVMRATLGLQLLLGNLRLHALAVGGPSWRGRFEQVIAPTPPTPPEAPPAAPPAPPAGSGPTASAPPAPATPAATAAATPAACAPPAPATTTAQGSAPSTAPGTTGSPPPAAPPPAKTPPVPQP